MTNSRAPPAVRPPPTNPGLFRKTGLAIPLDGVGNSITVKVSLLSMVKRLDNCLAFKPAMSSAAVTKTSLLPGAPIVGNGPLPGITRATVLGTALLTLFVAYQF